MTERSLPWESVSVGDATLAPYNADEWSQGWARLLGFPSRADWGVIAGYDSGSAGSLAVRPTGPASKNVEVRIGAGIVQGTLYYTDATLVLPIADNSSGNGRIDTVILRKDYVLQTIRAAVKQGTPAATPVPATLTQSAGTIWEVPLAYIAVANGFSTITEDVITPIHFFVNTGNGVYIDNVLNDSGITLTDGMTVIWKGGVASAVTTTTTRNHWRVAGVWRGRTPNGGYGRLQTRGFGKLLVQATNTGIGTKTIDISTPLVTSSVAGNATIVDFRANNVNIRGANGEGTAMATVAYLLEQLTVPGLGGGFVNRQALAYIDVQQHTNPATAILKIKGTGDAGTFTSGSWVARIFNTFNDGRGDGVIANFQNNYVTHNEITGTITLQPGRYRIRGYGAGYRVDGHLARLQDTTNTLTIIVSTPAYSPSAADSTQSFAEFETFLVVEIATNYQFQQRCTTTRATDGLGKYVGFSSESVTFVHLEITRLDEVLP